MSTSDVFILVVSLGAFSACLSIMADVQWGRHIPSLIVFQVAMTIGCMVSAYHASIGDAAVTDLVAPLVAGAWFRLLQLVYGRAAVPVDFETAPADLDEAAYPYINGGRK